MDNKTDPQLQQTLSQLKDIHLPQDSLAWPPAPGVTLLILAILILAILKINKIIKKSLNYYQTRTKFLALKELDAIQTSLNQTSTSYVKVTQNISNLLKKCAVSKFDKNTSQNIHTLSGEQWLQFLDKTGKTDQFSKADGRLLLSLVYQPEHKAANSEITSQINALINLTRNWIKINL